MFRFCLLCWRREFSRPVLTSRYLRHSVVGGELGDTLWILLYSRVMNNICVNHLFYADDSVLMASSPSALQTLSLWCIWQRKWNHVYLLYSYDNKINMKDLVVNNSALRWVSEQKYLGILINSNSSDVKSANDHHIADASNTVQSTYCRRK